MGLFSIGNGKQTDQQEAVLIHIDGTDLPDEFWQLNERLYEEVERSGTGEFDGNEIGEGSATLYAYGPDADRLFRAMEPILRSYPVCRDARIVIRHGGPGSPHTELKL
jgi:hypothetical protein